MYLDLRPSAQFIQGHHADSANIPADQLFQRSHELPTRAKALSLIGSNEELALAREFLAQRQYHIKNTQIYTPALLAQWQQQGLLQQGPSPVRHWQAAPLIQHFCETIGDSHLVKHPLHNQGLDLGCGAGRDMVHLAERGWQMTGLDYNQDAIARAKSLAQYNQQNVTLHQQDMSSGQVLLDQFGAENFDLIIILRYLNRDLFAAIRELLRPNGYIVFQTFMRGCEEISSPKNPNFLLEENELKQQFFDFNLIKDEIEILNDQRPLSAFIAQKPAG